MNYDLVRNGVFNIKDLDKIVLRPVSRPILLYLFSNLYSFSSAHRTYPLLTNQIFYLSVPKSSTHPPYFMANLPLTCPVIPLARPLTRLYLPVFSYLLIGFSQFSDGCFRSTVHYTSFPQYFSNGNCSRKILEKYYWRQFWGVWGVPRFLVF